MLPIGLLLAERRWPLRPVDRDARRLGTNAVFGLLATVTEALLDVPLARWTARGSERRRWGLSRLPSSAWRTLAGVLWLDWTLYLWHRATHRHPGLWRLHLPHHLDPAMDVTTAWRFHVAELLASLPFRAAQVASVGVPEDALRLWQRLLVISISFHHSNLRLPEPMDRALGWVVMTPRLHGIHHSIPSGAARLELVQRSHSLGPAARDVSHGAAGGDPARGGGSASGARAGPFVECSARAPEVKRRGSIPRVQLPGRDPTDLLDERLDEKRPAPVVPVPLTLYGLLVALPWPRPAWVEGRRGDRTIPRRHERRR